MKICMLLPSKFPPDIRVEKEAKSLIKAGHEVHLICEGGNDSSLEDNVNRIKVHRIQDGFWQKHRIIGRYLWWFFPIDLMFLKRLKEIVVKYKINAIHVHDLPLAFTAVIGRGRDIPIILDLHENWPEMLRAFGYDNLIVSISKIWERMCCNACDHLVVIIDAFKKHLVKNIGLPADKITVVMNTVDLEDLENTELDKEILEQNTNKFNIVYTGGFIRDRGLDVPIKAMKTIVKKIPNAHLILIGARKDTKELEKLCHKLGLSKHVTIVHWVDFDIVRTYISLANVCLDITTASPILFPASNKKFIYMAMGKPVVVSDCGTLGGFVRAMKCGLVFPIGDHERLSDAIIKLNDDRELSKQLGEKGRKAVKDRYNWTIDGERLCSIYNRLR